MTPKLQYKQTDHSVVCQAVFYLMCLEVREAEEGEKHLLLIISNHSIFGKYRCLENCCQSFHF